MNRSHERLALERLKEKELPTTRRRALRIQENTPKPETLCKQSVMEQLRKNAEVRTPTAKTQRTHQSRKQELQMPKDVGTRITSKKQKSGGDWRLPSVEDRSNNLSSGFGVLEGVLFACSLYSGC